MFEHISVPVDKIIDEVASIAGRDVASSRARSEIEMLRHVVSYQAERIEKLETRLRERGGKK